MKATIKFYIAIFLRRLHYFLAIFGLVTLAAVTVARVMPPVYVSEARLLVESAQIPEQLAAATVNTAASEQLQIIEQRLLTRGNLLDIARRMKVFPDSGGRTADSIVKDMREMTTMRRQSGRGQATFMTIAFESEFPRVAANVVNEYVTLVLKDNIEIRTDRAGETLEFFEQDVERLSLDLAKQSAKIVEYKNANSDALPETLEYRLNQQGRQSERLTSIEREVSFLREQKVRLKQIFEATGRLGPISRANQSPEQLQLTGLQDQLQNALAILSPENPKVKLLETQIQALEAVVKSQTTSAVPNGNPEASILDIQLAEIDLRIENLEGQARLVSDELALLDQSLERTSQVSISLGSLQRDYENVQKQYNIAIDRLAKAATGERIELLSKGQRILILDAATVPSSPTKPNRTAISVAGAALGAGLGLGLIVLLEFMNAAVRRPADIVRALGVTPIATIPYIRTPMELVVRRAVFLGLFLAIAVGIPAILFSVHTYYLPLDLIFDRLAEKVGAAL